MSMLLLYQSYIISAGNKIDKYSCFARIAYLGIKITIEFKCK